MKKSVFFKLKKSGLFILILIFSLNLNQGFCGEIKNSEQVEQVIVTAQKKEENIKDVPISITVIGEEAIEESHIKSIKDVGALTPNLLLFENGVSGMISPSFRGITSDIEARAVPSGMYIDGIPVLAGIGFDEPLMDIERIEILRGPQGTLYGKNTEAGVINVITKQPGNKTSIKGAVEIGEDNKREFSFSGSAPLIKDKFFIGISGRHYEKDGFLKDYINGGKLDDKENNYGKLNLRFKPTDKLDISLIGSFLKYNDDAAQMNYAGSPKDKILPNIPGYNKSESTMSVLKVKYDFSKDTSFESISSLRNYDLKTRQDWDFSQENGYHVDRNGNNRTLSQEFKLNSCFSDRFKYTAGLYLEKNDDDLRVDTNFYSISTDFRNSALGLFGHARYELTDSFSIIGGLRYDREEKEIEDKDQNVDESSTYDSISPKLAVEYKVNEDFMTWLSVSKGYRSGGYSTFIVEGNAHAFDEEQLISYELGFKSTMLNDRVSLNGSIYYMDIDDMQVQEPLAQDMEITTNAAKATSKGAELEVNAKVNRYLRIFAGLGINDISFDEFKDINGDYSDNDVPFAPGYNFNAGAQLRSSNGFYGRVEVTGYGEMYFDKTNKNKKDEYSIVNSKIGYEGEWFDCYLYAKNLFDKEYDSEGYYNGYYTIYSPPREAGVRFVFRY